LGILTKSRGGQAIDGAFVMGPHCQNRQRVAGEGFQNAFGGRVEQKNGRSLDGIGRSKVFRTGSLFASVHITRLWRWSVGLLFGFAGSQCKSAGDRNHGGNQSDGFHIGLIRVFQLI